MRSYVCSIGVGGDGLGRLDRQGRLLGCVRPGRRSPAARRVMVEPERSHRGPPHRDAAEVTTCCASADGDPESALQ